MSEEIIDNIDNIEQLNAALIALGYTVGESDDETLNTFVGKPSNPFNVVMTIDDESLRITCPISRIDQISEEKWAAFSFAALSANTRIVPFAFSILEDETSEDYGNQIIALTDSVPVGDLCNEEVGSAMDSLRAALLSVGDVLRVGYETETPEPVAV